jgi:MFS superfamily sulfate permease-like transporter
MGIVLGLLAPLLAMMIYYFLNFSRSLSLSDYFFILKTNKPLLTAISSISLLANAVIFTIYINTHRDQTAKGVFVATLLYGIFILIYKLIS